MIWYKQILSWWDKVWGMKPKAEPKADPKAEPEQVTETIDINSITWLGSNYANASRVAKINSANMTFTMIYTDYVDYSGLGWTRVMHGEKLCDAMPCLFYKRDGKIVGGKFDHWSVGGQQAKTLVNVYDIHYNGHSMPAPDADVWTMFVDQSGKFRSNIVKVVRK